MIGDIAIRGGEVVTADDRRHIDVLIHDGKVVELGDADNWDAAETIDAQGHLVLPGGVDTHTHFEHHSATGATRTADDFRSGTAAAAAGGTTTVVDFVRRLPGESLSEAFVRRLAEARRGSLIDFGFHPIVPAAALDDGSFDELISLTKEYGTTSWKFFMAYPGQMASDDTLLEGFRLARQLGVLPMVHAENGHIVADATAGLVESGQTAEHMHTCAHPVVAEREAINRAAALAEWVDSPLFVVHVSSADGVREIASLQEQGRPVFGETCPHYLVRCYEEYADLDFEAAKFVCSPPIRSRSHQDELWQALASGTLGSVGTDHAAFAMDQPDDLPPQKPQGRGYFPSIPNGVPGAEERLMVLYEHGVRAGRFDITRFVDMVATAPAKMFGLYPRKGTVAVGSDADIVVWDPEADHRIEAVNQQSRARYSLYEGMQVSGVPRQVISRGERIVRDGVLSATAGRGQYLHRTAVSSISR